MQAKPLYRVLCVTKDTNLSEAERTEPGVTGTNTSSANHISILQDLLLSIALELLVSLLVLARQLTLERQETPLGHIHTHTLSLSLVRFRFTGKKIISLLTTNRKAPSIADKQAHTHTRTHANLAVFQHLQLPKLVLGLFSKARHKMVQSQEVDGSSNRLSALSAEADNLQTHTQTHISAKETKKESQHKNRQARKTHTHVRKSIFSLHVECQGDSTHKHTHTHRYLTFRPVRWIFSVSWSTATLLGAHTRIWPPSWFIFARWYTTVAAVTVLPVPGGP